MRELYKISLMEELSLINNSLTQCVESINKRSKLIRMRFYSISGILVVLKDGQNVRFLSGTISFIRGDQNDGPLGFLPF